MSAVAHAGPTGRIFGKVTVKEADGKAVPGSDVIVYVVGFAEPPGPGPSIRIEQNDRRFKPDLVAITVGESIAFPNGDPILHNVFSQSPARKFDLGSFKRNESKEKQFPGPGVIDVYCNIHPEMAATILVLPNRRHVRAGSDGTFALEGVPVGNWQLFAYTRRATRPVMARITVTAGGDAKQDLALVRGAEADHPNKYGERYRHPGGNYR
ncbi:MAG: hypothetical protein WKG01_30245 [Kofleriaceae bacterium]